MKNRNKINEFLENYIYLKKLAVNAQFKKVPEISNTHEIIFMLQKHFFH